MQEPFQYCDHYSCGPHNGIFFDFLKCNNHSVNILASYYSYGGVVKVITDVSLEPRLCAGTCTIATLTSLTGRPDCQVHRNCVSEIAVFQKLNCPQNSSDTDCVDAIAWCILAQTPIVTLILLDLLAIARDIRIRVV